MVTTTSILLGAEAPRVLTVPMLRAALADRKKLPARNTLFNWIGKQVAIGALRSLTRGLYINQLADPRPMAAEATSFVRSGAIVSLQTVLGEAGVTNNYSDIVTAVLPQSREQRSSVRPVRAKRVEFRFHAMPARLLDERAGELEDRMDLDVRYPRATKEKALLDWIYLGASSRTKISGPPLDTDLRGVDRRRLRRLAQAMQVEQELERYLKRKRKYDRDPEVRANMALEDSRSTRNGRLSRRS